METEASEEVAGAEPVECTRCGDFVDPAGLRELEGDRMCGACVRAGCDRPWSPQLVGGLAFLFGFGGAGVVHTINQRRLGREVRGFWWRIAAWVVGFGGLLALFAVLPEDNPAGRSLGFAVNMGALLFFSRAGKERFEAYREAGGEVGKWYSALGISLGVTAALAVVLLGGLVAYSTARFEEATAAMDAGDHERAFAIFDEECDQGEPAACTNAGWIAEQRGDGAAARGLYERACDDDEPTGCNNLGTLVEAEGAPDGMARARELYRRACELGEPLGCQNLEPR